MTVFIPQTIYIEKQVKNHHITRQVLKRCPHVPREIVPTAKTFIRNTQSLMEEQAHIKSSLLLCKNRGRFLERCPGTKHYLCCGYTILNTGTGCPLKCTYCVLQAYLNNPFITLYVNWEDMLCELQSSKKLLDGEILRIGTGEYGDSLALEHVAGFVPFILPFVKGKKGLTLELKTKTTQIDSLTGINHGGAIVVSWSLNAEEIASKEEIGCATVKERILAAKQLTLEGYRVGFHFDPLIFYPGWEQGYRRVIDLLSSHIPPSQICWISLGTLRFMPKLKQIHRKNFPQSSILSQEFITGLDGKMRYLQDIRIQMYAKVASWLREYSPDIFIYLCMESPVVWKKSLGFAPASNESLKKMLDQQCLRFSLQ